METVLKAALGSAVVSVIFAAFSHIRYRLAPVKARCRKAGRRKALRLVQVSHFLLAWMTAMSCVTLAGVWFPGLANTGWYWGGYVAGGLVCLGFIGKATVTAEELTEKDVS